MATALTEDCVNHIKTMDEFSPEPEYPPIVSTTNITKDSTFPRYISLGISVTESLSQPDIIDSPRTQLEDENRRAEVQLQFGGDLSQPLDMRDAPVFNHLKEDMEEEDQKLVDWVFSMYVPTCRSLLECCQAQPVNLHQLQQYLRLLSNSITFFCNEHQEIQKQRESFGHISPSKSFTGLDSSYEQVHHSTAMFGHTLSPSSPKPHSQSLTSVSVKVLRSITKSLLPPLLEEVSGELTDRVFRDIIVAIQKISWKVEACLSSCNGVDNYFVHNKIFDEAVLTEAVKQVMIASPPEEMKLQNSPAHLAVYGLKEDQISLDSDMEAYWERQRRKNNSIGDLTSQSQESSKERYFRPGRRTTVSISKRQVQKIGLIVVDATAPDSMSPKRSNTVGSNARNGEDTESLESIRDRVLQKLAKEFPQFKTDTDDSDVKLLKRPSTLPVSSGSKLHPITETRSSSAPLPPINQGPLYPSHCRDRHSHEPTVKEEEGVQPKGNLGERTKSLEFERMADLSPVHMPSSTLTQTVSTSRLPPSKSSSTMPGKRRETFVKLVKKKAKSFGRADKHRTPVTSRKQASSEFFSPEQDRTGSESPIEQFVLKAHPREASCRSSDYLRHLNVEVFDKVSISPRRRKFSVSTNMRHQPTQVEMRIITDIPDLLQKEYCIQRPLKDTLALYDLLLSTTVTAGCLPDRPDKRARDWRQQVEDFFQFVASSPELRTVPEFVSFMKPGEMNAACNATLHRDSEFELLTTFFTPLTYPAGLPGTHHEVDVIGKDIPSTPTATIPRRSRRSYPSISNAKGSIHIKKNDGDEEATFIIREEGKDVLIISEEQDRFVVVAGTFKKLVEQLACEEKPDPRYVSTLLLGHRQFATSEDLLSLLIKRFKMTEAPDASEEELAYSEKWRYVIQLRVLDIIAYWMKSFWNDFQRSPQAFSGLQLFIEELHSSNDHNFSSAAISMSSTMNDKLSTPVKWARHSSSSSSSFSPSRSPSCSPMHNTLSFTNLDVNSFTGIQLARQLTLIELDFLRAIEVYELAFYTWGSADEGREYRKNLDAYIARFNKVSYWVASEILQLQDERLRGTLIEKFTEVAKHCQELRNFNTAVSVITGLSSTCIRRLEKSWKYVNERALRSFNKLKGLITPTNNHMEYRKVLSSVAHRDACIPYFGVFMRDITLCNEGTPKKLKNGLYNFSKLRTLIMMFEDIRQYQRSKFYFPSDDRAQNFCMNLWSLEEHELYDISCTLEPREDQLINESATQ